MSDFLPPDGTQVEAEVPDGCTVVGMIRHFRVSPEHLWMVSVNDSVVGDESVLRPLDRVTLFTHITGG